MAVPATIPATSSNSSFAGTKQYNYSPIQSTDKVREVVRGKDMNELLYDLLSIASPHKSEGEAKVRDTIIAYLKQLNTPHYVDKFGNLIAQVGKIGEHGSRTMFSAHMDTVHYTYATVTPMITVNSGADDGYVYGAQKIVTTEFHNSLTDKYLLAGKLPNLYKALGVQGFNPSLVKVGETADGNHVFRVQRDKDGRRVVENSPVLTKYVRAPKYTEKVLGADDKVGCYILCNLIKNKVPGLYVFHVGEECGGKGSTYIAEKTPELVTGMQRCIAFDRRGTSDIIIEQAGGECASKEFGDAFAAALNAHMPPFNNYASSRHGVFTDSANYTHLIEECTNVSVSYQNEHTTREHFDLQFLEMILIPALLKVDFEKLPVKRDKTESKYSRYSRLGGYGNYMDWDQEDYYAGKYGTYQSNSGRTTQVQSVKPVEQSTANDKRLLANLDKVPVGAVTKDTPLDKLPLWEPDDGLIYGLSKDSMEMLIAGWIINQHKTARQISQAIYELLQAKDELEDELAEMEDRLCNPD